MRGQGDYTPSRSSRGKTNPKIARRLKRGSPTAFSRHVPCFCTLAHSAATLLQPGIANACVNTPTACSTSTTPARRVPVVGAACSYVEIGLRSRRTQLATRKSVKTTRPRREFWWTLSSGFKKPPPSHCTVRPETILRISRSRSITTILRQR